MSDAEPSRNDFGTGLRAALARARTRRDAEPAPPASGDVVSPELALVARDVRGGGSADAAPSEEVEAIS
jgi:hypothetical protein